MLRFTSETCYSLLWHIVVVTMLTFVVPLFTLYPDVANQIAVMLLASIFGVVYLMKQASGISLTGSRWLDNAFLVCPWIPLRLMLLCWQVDDHCNNLVSKRCIKAQQRVKSLLYHQYMSATYMTGAGTLRLLLALDRGKGNTYTDRV